MKIITVDWDFFVPERMEWDLSHKENLLFLKTLWMTRYQLKDEMKTSGKEVGFWEGVEGKKLYVSDSHAYVYSLLKGAKEVVSYDTHHDCWPLVQMDQVFCNDWGTLFQMTGGRLKWVHPTPENLGRADLKQETFHGKVESGDVIHICRSGCWTPPWLDRNFIRFVHDAEKALGTKAIIQQDGDWNPMKERFSKQDYKSAEAQLRMFKAFRRKVYAQRSSNREAASSYSQKAEAA